MESLLYNSTDSPIVNAYFHGSKKKKKKILATYFQPALIVLSCLNIAGNVIGLSFVVVIVLFYYQSFSNITF